MQLLNQLCETLARSVKKNPATVAESVIKSLGMPYRRGDGNWVAARVVDRFQLTLFLRPDGNFIHVTVCPDIYIDREWLQRDLTLCLLEESNRYPLAAFRLAPSPRGHVILLSQSCDCRAAGEEDVRVVCEELLSGMQVSATRWYAEGLVTAGEFYLKNFDV